jgi:tRNA (guanine-N7-)-methyltransferase
MTDEGATTPHRRAIRSFVTRGGRITAGQQKAYDEHWPNWGLDLADGPVDLSAAFGRDAPVVLEIGFGMGQSLAETAAQNPHKNFIGIEVHRPGVGRLVYSMDEMGLDNIRIYCADAVAVIAQCIPRESLSSIQIFFPDPWHKKRHHKRRLIQSGFVQKLIPLLQVGGQLHLATDWQSYAEQMLKVLSANSDLQNSSPTGGYVPRPESRPITKFERRGARLGHGVWDLIFIRL